MRHHYLLITAEMSTYFIVESIFYDIKSFLFDDDFDETRDLRGSVEAHHV
jgi:hypothetical protein